MMVAFLPSGFKLASIASLSPQVTLGPYGDNVLSRPLKLYISLDITEGSTVLVKRSETDCIEALAWQDVPPEEYVRCDGQVVITTMGNTIYQVLSGPEDVHEITITGYYLHFSLFQQNIDEGKALQLQCADEKSVCARPEGEVPEGEPFHQLCTAVIRWPPGTDLKMVMRNRYKNRKRICQITSPYSTIEEMTDTLLDETFFVHMVCPGAEKTFNPGQHVTAISSSTTNELIEYWRWEVDREKAGDRVGCGLFKIQGGVLNVNRVEQQGKANGSTKSSPEDRIDFQPKSSFLKRIQFCVDWADMEASDTAVQQSGFDKAGSPEGDRLQSRTVSETSAHNLHGLAAAAKNDDQSRPEHGHNPVTMTSEQRSLDVLGTVASQPSQTISPEAITTVGGCMPSLNACRALAAKLKFSHMEMLKFNEFDEMTGQRILSQWYLREAENATGPALYNALCAIDLKAIADDCKGILFEDDSAVSAKQRSTVASRDVRHPERQLMTKRASLEPQLAEAGVSSGGKRMEPKCEEIPLMALRELAERMDSQSECIRLAFQLGFKGSDVTRWTELSDQVLFIAEQVLLLWNAGQIDGKQGTRSALENALLAINRQDLCDFFKKKCDELTH